MSVTMNRMLLNILKVGIDPRFWEESSKHTVKTTTRHLKKSPPQRCKHSSKRSDEKEHEDIETIPKTEDMESLESKVSQRIQMYRDCGASEKYDVKENNRKLAEVNEVSLKSSKSESFADLSGTNRTNKSEANGGSSKLEIYNKGSKSNVNKCQSNIGKTHNKHTNKPSSKQSKYLVAKEDMKNQIKGGGETTWILNKKQNTELKLKLNYLQNDLEKKRRLVIPNLNCSDSDSKEFEFGKKKPAIRSEISNFILRDKIDELSCCRDTNFKTTKLYGNEEIVRSGSNAGNYDHLYDRKKGAIKEKESTSRTGISKFQKPNFGTESNQKANDILDKLQEMNNSNCSSKTKNAKKDPAHKISQKTKGSNEDEINDNKGNEKEGKQICSSEKNKATASPENLKNKSKREQTNGSHNKDQPCSNLPNLLLSFKNTEESEKSQEESMRCQNQNSFDKHNGKGKNKNPELPSCDKMPGIILNKKELSNPNPKHKPIIEPTKKKGNEEEKEEKEESVKCMSKEKESTQKSELKERKSYNVSRRKQLINKHELLKMICESKADFDCKEEEGEEEEASDNKKTQPEKSSGNKHQAICTNLLQKNDNKPENPKIEKDKNELQSCKSQDTEDKREDKKEEEECASEIGDNSKLIKKQEDHAGKTEDSKIQKQNCNKDCSQTAHSVLDKTEDIKKECNENDSNKADKKQVNEGNSNEKSATQEAKPKAVKEEVECDKSFPSNKIVPKKDPQMELSMAKDHSNKAMDLLKYLKECKFNDKTKSSSKSDSTKPKDEMKIIQQHEPINQAKTVESKTVESKTVESKTVQSKIVESKTIQPRMDGQRDEPYIFECKEEEQIKESEDDKKKEESIKKACEEELKRIQPKENECKEESSKENDKVGKALQKFKNTDEKKTLITGYSKLCDEKTKSEKENTPEICKEKNDKNKDECKTENKEENEKKREECKTEKKEDNEKKKDKCKTEKKEENDTCKSAENDESKKDIDKETKICQKEEKSEKKEDKTDGNEGKNVACENLDKSISQKEETTKKQNLENSQTKTEEEYVSLSKRIPKSICKSSNEQPCKERKKKKLKSRKKKSQSPKKQEQESLKDVVCKVCTKEVCDICQDVENKEEKTEECVKEENEDESHEDKSNEDPTECMKDGKSKIISIEDEIKEVHKKNKAVKDEDADCENKG